MTTTTLDIGDLDQYGSNIAIQLTSRSTTFARLAQRARWLAAGLRTLGLGEGDRVGLLCCAEHADDHLVAYFAVRSIGARPVLFTYASRPEVVAMIREA